MCKFSLLKMVKFIKMVLFDKSTMPQQPFPVWVYMFTQVACVADQFLTPPPLPHFVLLQLQLCMVVMPQDVICKEERLSSLSL